MKIRDFFDSLRMYPDWDKEIFIGNEEGEKLADITDIACDDETGDLIIVKKEAKNDKKTD